MRWRLQDLAVDRRRSGALTHQSPFSTPKHSQYLNSIVEQDHRRIKRLVQPGLGFCALPTAERTLAGYEAMAMIRNG
jgi:transposase, IS6 family